jgi:hypothetical protein
VLLGRTVTIRELSGRPVFPFFFFSLFSHLLSPSLSPFSHLFPVSYAADKQEKRREGTRLLGHHDKTMITVFGHSKKFEKNSSADSRLPGIRSRVQKKKKMSTSKNRVVEMQFTS